MSQLLAPHEGPAFVVERAEARSAFVLSCDHAGYAIPESLGNLGLSLAERQRHIGWDIGALGVARALSARLDAALVWQPYSRLVVDCNRPMSSAGLIPERSEATEIPGNRGLAEADRERRVAAIHTPYHQAITALLDARVAAGSPSIFVAVHTFTPRYLGHERPWHVGVLSGDHRDLADSLLGVLKQEPDLVVGDNEPYRIDADDYGVPVHGIERGLLHVAIEIRQDLVTEETGQRHWADRLCGWLKRACSVLGDEAIDKV